MRLFLIALGFLTRIPTPRGLPPSAAEMGRSTRMYPLVGLVLGSILAVMHLLMIRAGGAAFFRGAVLVVAQVVLTGGLHLDGLMDTADGLWGCHGRERILEIMKDSRVGAHAVMAAVCLLLLKTGAASSLDTPAQAYVLLLMPIHARWVALFLASRHRHAGAAGGLGRVVMEGSSRRELIQGTLFCLAATAAAATLPPLFERAYGAYWRAFLLGGGLWLAAALSGVVTARAAHVKIGGLTGDVIGAAVELAESAALILGAVLT